jgi:hypothetical protein
MSEPVTDQRCECDRLSISAVCVGRLIDKLTPEDARLAEDFVATLERTRRADAEHTERPKGTWWHEHLRRGQLLIVDADIIRQLDRLHDRLRVFCTLLQQDDVPDNFEINAIGDMLSDIAHGIWNIIDEDEQSDFVKLANRPEAITALVSAIPSAYMAAREKREAGQSAAASLESE